MSDWKCKTVTCIAPVNIAVIKYWGKRDEDLILPVNDSFSLTLDTTEMHAKTSISISPKYESDKIWLNGVEESMTNPRLMNCLRNVRERAADSELKDWKVRICSRNNFPTAAGLASSAAGYACLVKALCYLYGVKGNISDLARLGSGSACRSIFGGFVRWNMGMKDDGTDSFSEQLFPADYWSDLKVLICVVNDSRKKVSSSIGMKNGVLTSDLLKFRASNVVPSRIKNIVKAVSEKNFEKFSELVIKDSNQFHAICQDTYPPNVYMNETSQNIIRLIHQINLKLGKSMACYTFDAGPNACIFLPSANVELISSYLKHFFPPSNTKDFFRGKDLQSFLLDEDHLNQINCSITPDSIQYVIHTSIGNGPKILESTEAHLLDPSLGIPKDNLLKL